VTNHGARVVSGERGRDLVEGLPTVLLASAMKRVFDACVRAWFGLESLGFRVGVCGGGARQAVVDVAEASLLQCVALVRL
jgi:hypothetical protein